MRFIHTQQNKILTALILFCVAGLSLFSAPKTSAAPNYEINYQGKLTNASNVAVADDTYNMRFWLLTSPSIATTSAVWTESLTGTNKVQVTNGLFSVMLGSTSPLTGVDFNQTLYLGVEIGGTSTPAWDSEMSPRKILGAVPAAFHASTSQNAVTVGGVASTSFIRSDEADTASGLLTFTGGIISNSSSTITNLTTLIATTTTLVINGQSFTNLLGTGLTNSGGALTASLGTDITAAEIANGDHGFFSYSSGVASLDTGGLTSANLSNALTDETGSGYAVFATNPLLSGFRSFASSTIGDGTGAGGLTIVGNSTTTLNARIGGMLTLGTTSSADIFINGGATSSAPQTNQNNVAIGNEAFSYYTIGAMNNIALGYRALFGSSTALMSGTDNIGLGSQSLYSNTDGSSNNAFGEMALYSNTEGNNNNALGAAALYSNTEGIQNNAFGGEALRNNTIGSDNNAFGALALYSNTEGSQNNALGSSALYSNINGNDNNALGYQSLNSNISGSQNNAFGADALYSNIDGNDNNALGYQSLYFNTNGFYNNALGRESLYSNTSGNYNNAFGYQSLYYNTSGSSNNALGAFALQLNTTGSYNQGLGYGAGISLGYTATSSYNTYIGYQAGYSQTQGDNNIVIGTNAGYNLGTATSTTFLGAYTNTIASALSSSTALGAGALLTRSNTMVLGGTGANSVDIVTGTSTPWAKLSIQNNYGSTTPLFDIATTTSSAYATSSLFRVNHDGKVGIASSSPSRLLTVEGQSYLAYASTTGLTATNANITNATSTTLAATGSFKIGSDVITDITGTNLSVTNGILSASASGGSNWLFDGTRLTPSSTSAIGIVTLASSTIGGGTGAGGLTINGGATTTGNAYFASRIGVGTNNPQFAIDINPSTATDRKLGINGTQVLYLPDQATNFTGTLIVGNSGGSLSHVGSTDAFYNNFFGIGAGNANTTGNANTLLGYQSGYYTNSGSENSFVGYQSGYSNTTSNNNSYLGALAGYNNQTGQANSIVGYGAGQGVASNSFSNNSLFGYRAGYVMTTGSNNLLLGYQTGNALTSGSNNIALGYDIDLPSNTASNQLTIGNLIFGTGIDGTGTSISSGKIGIASNTPSRLLTVAGDIYAQNNITAASGTIAYASTTGLTATNANITNATSTTLAATGSFKIGSDVITDITGTNLSITNGILSASVGGGGSSNWLFDGTRLTPSSTSAIGIVTLASSTIGGGTGASGLTISGGATTTGNAYFGGKLSIGSTSPESETLTIDKSGLTGSVIGGIKERLQFTNSTLSALYYGDNTYIVNAPTATSTLVGKMIRIEDSSGLGNTVRGLEVQAYRGTNTKGENTALSGFARTFGVRGTTLGDAGDTYQPAGVFAETQGTTQGNALRAYSGTITSEELVSFYHDGSAFTGTGLLMNFGNTTGSFTGSSAKFVDFQVAGDSKFVVGYNGYTGIGSSTPSRALTVAGETYLGATTTIAAHFLPLTDDTYDLGSTSLRFRDLYVGPATIHIGSSLTDEATFSYDTGSNIFNIGTDSTSNGDIAFFTDDLFVDKSTGYVGIGTTTPWGALTVGGTAQFTDLAVNGTFSATSSSLGTPSSLTLTNATGLPVSTGISGLGTGVATFLATPSSANLASAVTGETGSGALVFATSPSFTTPSLGAASASSLTLSSQLAVSYGGTGATTLTGIVKGNGTGAFTAISGGLTVTDALADGCTSGSGGSVTFSSGIVTAFTSASSCYVTAPFTPYIFAWDGKGYKPVSDFLFGYPKTHFNSYLEGIVTYEAGEVGEDIYPLAVAPVLENGAYKVDVREIEAEDTYLDRFLFYKVGHASGTTIVTDNEFKDMYALADEELSDLIEPSHIVSEDISTTTPIPDVLVTFPSRGSGKLIFDANLRTGGGSVAIDVSYQDSEGEWVKFTAIQPRRPHASTYVIDLPEELNGTFTLRFKSWADIEMHSIGIMKNFTPLSYDEKKLTYTEPPRDRVTGEDVSDLISAKDNTFHRLTLDDAISFQYADEGVEGEKTTFVLRASGFYVGRGESSPRTTSLSGKVSYLEDLVNGLETRTSFIDFMNGTTTVSITESDSLWNRIVTLAGNFVDGVLTLAGLKTDELCVGAVCVDEATFLQMVENAGAVPLSSGGTGGSEGTAGGETGGDTGTTTDSGTGSDTGTTTDSGTGGGETTPSEEPPAETPPPEEPAPEPPAETPSVE